MPKHIYLAFILEMCFNQSPEIPQGNYNDDKSIIELISC